MPWRSVSTGQRTVISLPAARGATAWRWQRARADSFLDAGRLGPKKAHLGLHREVDHRSAYRAHECRLGNSLLGHRDMDFVGRSPGIAIF